MMKFINLLYVGLALISLNGVAATTQSIPTDAGAHLLKRLGLKEDFEGTYYFVGKKSGSTCFVDAEVSWEGDDNLRFIITVSDPTKFKTSLYQGRFGKDHTDAVEFSESENKLKVVSHSKDADSQLSNLELVSNSDGSIQNIQVAHREDSRIGRLMNSSVECSNLKPLTRDKLNNPSREGEVTENDVWSLSSIREFFRQMRERMDPKYTPAN